MAEMKLDVILTPALIGKGELDDCICAVVDVLRATSTITVALVNGCTFVFPCLNITESRRCVEGLDRGSYLLGGEEMGMRIPDFDLGNSPLEYNSRDVVEGKALYFYTSNGTSTIRKAHAECGWQVYIASLLNISAVSATMVSAAADGIAGGVSILCSGRYGRASVEDLFCAGLMIEKVSTGLSSKGIDVQITDEAAIAAVFADANRDRPEDVLNSGVHGRYLKSIGFAADLDFASRIDEYDVNAVFDGEKVVLFQYDR